MQIITVATREEFADRLSSLRKLHETSIYKLLYRGQSNPCWSLVTSLERATSNLSVYNYYNTLLQIAPQVETFTGFKWSLPDDVTLREVLDTYDFRYRIESGNMPALDYMIYLRHHKFPSPLLDWSCTPYVAAYFALSNASDNGVAIYVLSEKPMDAKFTRQGFPSIYSLRHNIKNSHQRHFLQKSSYTVCANFTSHGWHFSPHEAVFDAGEPEQDLLWKFIIPKGERVKILKLLDEYNLNALSLFGSEESLMETMKMRVFDFAEAEQS